MIDLPNHISTNRIADWVELYLAYNQKQLSRASVIDIYESDGNDIERYMDSVMLELLRRQTLYGSSAPFEIAGNVMTPVVKWNKLPEYTLCLIFSTYGVEDISSGGTTLFERLSTPILNHYLRGESLLLGFPISTNLKQQLDLVATRSFENRGSRNPLSRDKDVGVDAICWKPFNDGRSGQIILLVQAGAGADWREKKAN